jgi:hypothetical protein
MSAYRTWGILLVYREMHGQKANNNVEKQFSLNSGIKDNHRSKTATIKDVNLAALNTPPEPH